MTQRLERMLSQAPDYYETSAIYRKIQAAQSNEYDSLEAKNADLKAQLRIRTATWGLRFYEEALHIPVIPTDSYEVRRGRVLAKWRSPGNFSAALVKSVCESFVNGQVDVDIDLANSTVLIKFVGPLGVPEKMADVEAAIDNIIHAHLGWSYSFRYLLVSEVHGVMTYAELQQLTYNYFAPFTADI
jgi:hypothetical protein